jgi:hypothetical protein
MIEVRDTTLIQVEDQNFNKLALAAARANFI